MMSFSVALAYRAVRPLTLPVVVTLAICALPVVRAACQPANADIIGRLAADCVTTAVATADTVEIIPDDRYEFIRTVVVNSVRDDGSVVVISRTPQGPSGNEGSTGRRTVVSYRIENGGVRYSKSGDALTREIAVDTRVLATMSDNSVVLDTLCVKSFIDEIRPADIDKVEDSNQPLTLGKRPSKGWLRRVAEPAVVAAASAVAVYLFFNVRSDRNETP